MQSISSTEAKTHFGDVLLKSQKEPVSVTRNGKPVAVVMSEDEYRELKLQALRVAVLEGELSGDAGPLDMNVIKAQAKQEYNSKT
ncbi:MAG: type II toxin-antitoxin system Phd/YefM family antitoxin [Methylocystaceae bacterium]|nr:type II toxin-antitoxin system Phd/YefM family antitoxin [Methylocystaceae bacterium]